MKLSKLHYSFAAIMALNSIGLSADDTLINDQNMTQLGKMTVSASRIEQEINDTASNVVVIDTDQIEMQGANDIKDLMRYEPDISEIGRAHV